MSDMSQGPGWWQASDGKWYPPEQSPGVAAPAPPVAPVPPPGYGPPPQPGAMPVGGVPGFGPPPQQYGGPPMGYAPPAKSGMGGCLKAFLIVLAIVVVLGVAGTIAAVMLVDDAVDDLGRTNAGEADDVQDIECDDDQFGDLTATVTVENDSSERSNYIITVTFEDSGGRQVATGTAFINAVGSDQEATGEVFTGTDAPEGRFTCEIATVERFSDETGG